ncbi:MAG: sulfatase [Lentisphaerae bacterium]|nr:MAG: sulfatase [Lentisphaerota bacterium]
METTKVAQKKKLNILWISFEDTNPYYGCYGDRVAKTPNLDQLAAEGCRWPLTFSTAGVCAPARSAIITGMYPCSMGAHHMRTTHTNDAAPELPTPYSAVPPHYVRCLPEYFRAAGYYCTNNVKTDYQFKAPVTAWDELSTEAHWRNRPDPDQPFFAVFNLGRSHESGMWPEKCPEVTVDPDAIELPPYFPDTPKVREAMARMYTNIEYNDRILGELLKQLEEDGLAENTVVFHWSDHGPLPRGKRWPYDSGIHVPMIVRWPGVLEPGSVSEQLISTIDLPPTVLSVAGLPIPYYMQGQAFLGEQAAPEREYIFATRDRYDESYDMIRAVRDRRFKYIRHYDPLQPYLLWIPYRNRHPILQEMWRLHLEDKLEWPQSIMFQPRPAEELYDTENDPWEINNLAGDPAYREVLERMRKALDDWRQEIHDMGEINEEEMVRRWYGDARKQPQTATPRFIPITAEEPGIETRNCGSLQGPAILQLYCPTQGASMEYRLDTPECQDSQWHLYTQPIRLPKGDVVVRARAARIGFRDSEEVMASFHVS